MTFGKPTDERERFDDGAQRNRMRARLRSGHPTVGAWCVSGSPAIAEVMAGEPFDYVALDLQHGLLGYESFLACMFALSGSGVTPVARVPSNDPGWIGKVLDAGVEVVIVPMVESAGEAERAVQACRYAPRGRRSFGAIRGGRILGTDPNRVNEEVMCLVMIETRLGVEAAAEICAVDGVDGVYVGPADLGVSLGTQPSLAPVPGPHADAIELVRATFRASGKAAGIQCANGTEAKAALAAGFDIVTVCADLHLVRRSVRTELADAIGSSDPGQEGSTYG